MWPGGGLVLAVGIAMVFPSPNDPVIFCSWARSQRRALAVAVCEQWAHTAGPCGGCSPACRGPGSLQAVLLHPSVDVQGFRAPHSYWYVQKEFGFLLKKINCRATFHILSFVTEYFPGPIFFSGNNFGWKSYRLFSFAAQWEAVNAVRKNSFTFLELAAD